MEHHALTLDGDAVDWGFGTRSCEALLPGFVKSQCFDKKPVPCVLQALRALPNSILTVRACLRRPKSCEKLHKTKGTRPNRRNRAREGPKSCKTLRENRLFVKMRACHKPLYLEFAPRGARGPDLYELQDFREKHDLS
jgi:hypothetical protein